MPGNSPLVTIFLPYGSRRVRCLKHFIVCRSAREILGILFKDPSWVLKLLFTEVNSTTLKKKQKKGFRHPSISDISACCFPSIPPCSFGSSTFSCGWHWRVRFRCPEVLQSWHMSRLRLWIQKLRPPQSLPWLRQKLPEPTKNLRQHGSYIVGTWFFPWNMTSFQRDDKFNSIFPTLDNLNIKCKL